MPAVSEAVKAEAAPRRMRAAATHPAVVLLLAIVLVPAVPARAQNAAFVRAAPVVVGSGSGETFLADLDRDGHLDIVTKHLLSQRLSVRLGDGRGHFAAARDSVSFAYQPGTIALGDIDNDGVLDLAVARRDSVAEYVHIYRGTGTGTFVPATDSSYRTNRAVRTYKPWLRFADVDADGNLDVVTADGRRNTIEVLLGDGRGRFAAARVVTIEPKQDRYWFDIGDVDGDGHLDVVTLGSATDSGPARITVLRGAGNGAFDVEPRSSSSLPGVPRAVKLARVNDDERLDIVVGHGNGRLSVLLNTGKGAFTAATGSPYRIGAEAFAIAVANANGDHERALVAATVNSITVLVAGKQGFVSAPGSPFPAGPGAYNLALGDVDGDGKLDIVASSFEGDALTVLLAR